MADSIATTESTQTSAATATAKIVIKHRYTGAILFEYQPTEEQQASGTNPAASEVWICIPELGGANLGGANLIGKRPVFTVGPIGSRCDYFTSYLTDKGIYLRAGCFFGSVAEFTEKLRSQHSENSHAQEYTAALELIQSHARLWTPATEPA